MKRAIHLCLLLFLYFVFSASNAHAQSICGDIPIDDYSSSVVTELEVTVEPPEPLAEAVDDGGDGVIGRFRTLTLELIEGTFASSTGQLVIATDQLTYNNGATIISRASLLYDADGNGLSLDLSNRELLRLDILRLDTGLILTYVLTDENSNQASLTETAFAVSDPMELVFPFKNFAGIDSVDLSAIDSVEFVLEGTQAGVDASIAAIGFGCQQTLPPSIAVPTMNHYGYVVLALLLLGLGLFMASRSSH